MERVWGKKKMMETVEFGARRKCPTSPVQSWRNESEKKDLSIKANSNFSDDLMFKGLFL